MVDLIEKTSEEATAQLPATPEKSVVEGAEKVVAEGAGEKEVKSTTPPERTYSEKEWRQA